MHVSFFIARRLKFKGKFASVSIAVSFLVMILAVSVSSGFRHEIRNGLSQVSGDVQLMRPDMNYLDGTSPIEAAPDYLPYVESLGFVEAVNPVVYRAAIVKKSDDIYGILVKGIPGGVQAVHENLSTDSLSLAVSIPSRLAAVSGLAPGDRMLTYFVGDKMKVRQFTVAAVHETIAGTDDKFLVYADISDMRQLNGWNDGEASMLEIVLLPSCRSEEDIRSAEKEVGFVVNAYSSDNDSAVVASSSVSRFPQIFDWLGLIDFNVFFILALMSIVAGFNMVSGLLIMLFENIPAIGLLKAVGMKDRSIAGAFLSSAAVLVLKGMAAGNALAALLCVIQNQTKLLRLNPENYFVSFVPVHFDAGMIVLADAVAFVLIMLFLLIPCLFISKVDPADTVRVR